jgi:hypothetical protein
MRYVVIDSLLVYKELHTKNLCKIFDLNSGELLHKDIKRGEGPYEMIDCDGFFY